MSIGTRQTADGGGIHSLAARSADGRTAQQSSTQLDLPGRAGDGSTSRSGKTTSLALGLDRSSHISLERQLYMQLRDAILCGRIRPGARVPSTRNIASDLHCCRSTVVSAFGMLLAEGYLVGEQGSGTFVPRIMPEEFLLARRRAKPADAPHSLGQARLSKRGEAMAAVAERRPLNSRPFDIGVPDVEFFPFNLWGRLLSQFWRNPRRSLLIYGPPQGYMPLLERLSEYLREARGVHSTPQQIFITSGAQQAFDFLARVLLDPGESAAVEDPGYIGSRGALAAAGARIVPVQVDEEGLSVRQLAGARTTPRAVVVTPSHQFPLGVVMSLQRRLELLDWADTNDAWIIEDDYDSEFRYTGPPLTSLQGLGAGPTNGEGRVIYVGSLSKVLFPGLRLGYMVVPLHIVDRIVRARRLVDTQSPITIQPVVAEFLKQGHYLTHIRRMRRVYERRQQMLLKVAQDKLGDRLDLRSHDAGMHVIADLKLNFAGRMTDKEAARRAESYGIYPKALSDFYANEPKRSALLLGYAGMNETELKKATAKLSDALTIDR